MLKTCTKPLAVQIFPPAAHQRECEAQHELNDTINNYNVIAKDKMGLKLTNYEPPAPARVMMLELETFGSRLTAMHLHGPQVQLMKIKELEQDHQNHKEW